MVYLNCIVLLYRVPTVYVCANTLKMRAYPLALSSSRHGAGWFRMLCNFKRKKDKNENGINEEIKTRQRNISPPVLRPGTYSCRYTIGHSTASILHPTALNSDKKQKTKRQYHTAVAIPSTGTPATGYS